MASKFNAGSGQLTLLDVLVLVAMAITATAFAAGLIVNSGVDTMAGAIAGAALFTVMASAHFVLTRSARSGAVSGRLDQLEEALLILDQDLQRIDQVEDDVARLDLLTDRVERLDKTVSVFGGEESAGGLAQVDRLTADFEDLHTRLEALRSDLESEARSQRDKISTELRSLETLIRQLSRELTAAPASTFRPLETEPYRAQAAAAPVALDKDEQEEDEEPAEQVVVEALTLTLEEELPETIELPGPEAYLGEEPQADEPQAEEPEEADEAMLASVRRAIERTMIDLHLQPILSLPDLKPRYYEALSRLRTTDGDPIRPGSFLPVAEAANLMPLIDNVMLVKSVQILRRLGPESRTKGIFCNISVQSLLDCDFFPELVEFMEENNTLSSNLFFELGQAAILGLAAEDLSGLDSLGRLGFRFSLDHVADLDIDFAALRDRHFRFVKIEASALLQNSSEADLRDFIADLKRFGLEAIVEKVEDAETVDRLAELGVGLASGYALGEPRAFSSELIRELEDADAA